MINCWNDVWPNDVWSNDVWSNLMSPWQVPDVFGKTLFDFPFPALPSTPDGARRPAAGAFLTRRHDNPCGARDYKLYIPSAYAGQPLPLLVMLHGCSQNAEEFATATRMNRLAEQRQCFVVYPEQSASANCAKCWNWFNQHDQQRGQGEPAIIAGIAQEVMDEYGIDSARVFIAGLSAGGAMAVIMGRTYPDLFKAVGCHSGLPYGAATDACSAMDVMRYGVNAGVNPGEHSGANGALPQRRMPTIVFHGDGDTTVHPSHGAGVIRQSLMALPADAPSVHPLQRLVYRDVSAGRAYTHHVHCDAAGAMVAEEWIVHGAGHAWSGGDMQGTFADSRGPDAGTEMLRFFLPLEASEGAVGRA